MAAADAAALEPFADILRDEVNVKDVVLTDDVAAHGRFEIAVNARACGPRLGGDTQKVIRAVKAGEWSGEPGRHRRRPAGSAAAGRVHRAAGGGRRRGATAALPGNTGLVVLDTAVTPELAAEGLGARRGPASSSRPAATPGWTSPTGSR